MAQYQRDLSSAASRLNAAQELVRQELIEVTRLTDRIPEVSISDLTTQVSITLSSAEDPNTELNRLSVATVLPVPIEAESELEPIEL